MKIIVVNKSDLSIAYKYEDDAPAQHKYGGAWGDSEKTIHLQCSEVFDWECVEAIDNEGVIELQESQALLDAKVERQWAVLRLERDRRLTKCDWTQLPDSPLNPTDKTAWATYRQTLRDLPENTLDPAAPVWPEEPNVQI